MRIFGRSLHTMGTIRLLSLPLLFACIGGGPSAYTTGLPQDPNAMSFHQLSAVDIHGNPISMDRFKGKKVMVVNTASECGYTRQYKQLQELHEAYKDKGLVVIGFPCNDFGGQEPGTEAQIEAFCQKNYGVTFPMMAKVGIKKDPHPVYQWLTSKSQNGVMDAQVKWNFHKFLIDEEGRLLASHPSAVDPLDEKILSWLGS
jgi:glutathione peroxidase